MNLWETESTDDIAKAIKLEKVQVSYLVSQMRKAGVKLPKKHRAGYLHNLIKEVMGKK